MTPPLDAILTEALALLAEGAADPASAWRNLALGTLGPGAAPQIRTVVLRRFDATARTLDVHTDTRSRKYAELRAAPAACLHGWDPAARIQLRLMGPAVLHHADAIATASWAALKPASRATYAVRPGPGTMLDTPESLPPPGTETDSFAVFCVVRLHVHALEYLHLGQGSHRRARFGWEDSGQTAMWLVP